MCFAAAALIPSALSAVGSVAQFSEQSAAVKEENAMRAVARRDASLAAQRQYEDAGKKLIYDSRAAQQEGYRAEMKARSAASVARASTGTSGLSLGDSYSVDDILSAINQENAMNQDIIKTKQDELKDTYKNTVDSAEAQAKQRINSLPDKKGPSPLGLVINLAGTAFQGYNDYKAYKG